MTIRRREYKDRSGQQIWDYDFWHNNQRFRKAGFSSKAEAEIAETRARHLVYSGKTVLHPSTFEELVKPFLAYRRGRVAHTTFGSDNRRIKIMLPYFGNRKIVHITNTDIDAFISHRLKKGKAHQTINHAINLLSSIFQFAISHGYAYENPAKQIKRLKMVQVEPVLPSNDQFRALVEGARKTEVGLELATWLVFRGYSGTRPTESFYMEWRDVSFERNQIIIRPKEGNPLKNGKARVLPLSAELKIALLEWKQAWDKTFEGKKKPHDWIFFNPRFPHRQCRSFRKSYPRAQRYAGLTDYMTSHCLRHYFISKAVEAGINFLVIAKWVGHSSTKMIEQVYAHLSPEFKNNEMNKLQLGLMNGNGSNGAADIAGNGSSSQSSANNEKKVDSEGA